MAQNEEVRGGGYEDERMPKSDAIRFLGIVPKDNDELMARTRLSRRQVLMLTLLEVQERILNPTGPDRLLSAIFRKTLARNLLALDGLWRVEMQSILETQSEEKSAELALRE